MSPRLAIDPSVAGLERDLTHTKPSQASATSSPIPAILDLSAPFTELQSRRPYTEHTLAFWQHAIFREAIVDSTPQIPLPGSGTCGPRRPGVRPHPSCQTPPAFFPRTFLRPLEQKHPSWDTSPSFQSPPHLQGSSFTGAPTFMD
jgi:hypothetical protein